MTRNNNTSNTLPYKEKPGANSLIVFLIIAAVILLPVGIIITIAPSGAEFFAKAKDFIENQFEESKTEKPAKTSDGPQQAESVTDLESLNRENPSEGTRTVGNTIAGYIDVPIAWTEHSLGSDFSLQSFSFESGESAIYVTVLDPRYGSADEAMTALKESLEEDKNVRQISSVRSAIIRADHYYYSRQINYYDSSVNYYHRDFIFRNTNHDYIYISIAIPTNSEDLDYILESYREEEDY